MEAYGKSLRIDDPTYIPASHFQNNRIPRNEACYACHTNYAMFGGLKAKLGGLKHLLSTTSAQYRPSLLFMSLITIVNACTATPARDLLKKPPLTKK